LGRFARGIVAEPPVGAGLAPARARSAQRVMERIARREHPKGAKRLAPTKKQAWALYLQYIQHKKKQMRIFGYYLVMCFCLPLAAFAQQQPKYTISGYISDEETGERLIGASIFDANSKLGTATNAYGFFSLTLPQDSLVLVANYIGLAPQYFKFYLDRDTSINIPLLSVENMPTIEVVAEDMVQRIEERNQMSNINLPIAQIKAMPAFLGEVDVLKIIQLLPGVQSGEGSSGLYVRGGSPDQTLILLDGVPVYNAYHLFGFFSVFNADAIKSVQLTKGGYPARYGGRLAAILEINMKEGNMRRWQGEGSIGLISSKLTLSAPIVKDKASFMVSARRTYIDILARPFISLAQRGQDGQAMPGYYFYDLNAKINYIINAKNRLFLSFYAGDDKFSIRYTEKYDDNSTGSSELFELNSKIQWGNITNALRWNHQFSPKLFANTTLTYSRYNFNISTSFLDESRQNNQTERNYFGAKYASGIDDICAKIDFDYLPNPKHLIRFGGGATYHNFKPGATNLSSQTNGGNVSLTLGDSKINALEYALYAEDDMNLSDDLGANIGFHASAFQLDSAFYYSVQPRASLRYTFSPARVALKASFATMTQYIHLLTNEGIGLPTDLWVPSTANVRPEQSWQAALGFAKTFAKGFEVSIEGYYRDMRNLLSYKPGASFLDTDTNITWEDKIETNGKGASYGAELFVQKQKGKLTGWVSYTLAWNWRQFEDTDINFGKPYPFKYDRRHNIAIAAMYKFNHRVSFSAAWVYGTGNAVTLPTERYLSPNNYGGAPNEVQGISSKNAFRMPAYHRLDCSIDIKKQLKKWAYTWSFGVYNLYNRQNPFFIFASRDLQTNEQQFRQVSLFPIIPSVRWDFQF
jgi:outer membrane receptor for ferrienterochelin and colicin